MSSLHILDAGRGDCIVLLLEAPEGRRTVVIDGGTLRGRPSPLLPFLQTQGVEAVDLLILTHLHQDHFGGFFDLIGRVPVRRAVSPCGDLVWAEPVYESYGRAEYAGQYHAFFCDLAQRGAELIRTEDCIGRTFRFGAFSLRCLYPRAPGQQPAAALARALCDPSLTAGTMAPLLAEFRRLANADSSVWALWRNGVCLALFAGDSTEETLSRALGGAAFRPSVLKLSHHGVGDGYFSEALAARIAPERIVVSTAEDDREEAEARCLPLAAACGAALWFTWDGAFSLDL